LFLRTSPKAPAPDERALGVAPTGREVETVISRGGVKQHKNKHLLELE